jgi:stage II sporulation protein P
MSKRILVLVLTIILSLGLIIMPTPVEAGIEIERHWSPFSLLSIKDLDHRTGQCITIRDQNDQVITETARQVMVGDEIILPDGRHYRVKKVKNDMAKAKLLGSDKHYLSWLEYFQSNPAIPVAADWKDKPVGVYHTHTGESYLPDSGTDSKPYEGDIYLVGQSFVSELEKEKTNVIYYETPHDPHDSNAYMRSRRTAIGIMKNDPVAVFDIHRDGVPDPNKYRVTIDGKQVAQVRLVIGKQNPHRDTNTEFAKRLMAYAEKQHPGLIKDLYIGRGNYNQDLLSTAVLLESGTHTNSLAECQQGMILFADIIPVILGLTGEEEAGAEEIVGAGPIKETETSGWTTAIWLLVITIASVGAFLFISTGSMEKALEAGAKTVREMLLRKPEMQEKIKRVKVNITQKVGPVAQFKPIFKKKDQDK